MVIEKFEKQMIEEYIRSADLTFMVDQSGRFILDFHGDDVPDYRVLLAAEDRGVFLFRMTARTPYPLALRDRLASVAEGWNRRTRWPKAYLEDDWRGRGVTVVGENSYPLASGVHRPLLRHLIECNLFAAGVLLREVVQAVGTSPVDELETWLHEAG